jgi:hypothetical protein
LEIEKPELNNKLGTTEENKTTKPGFAIMIFPLILTAILLLGFTQLRSGDKSPVDKDKMHSQGTEKNNPKINFTALLAQDEFSSELRDTVYTDKNIFLELRIDEQMVHVHYKDGRIKNYPVSTGNKFLSKGIESRPGLFAIFLKEELHLSSQFDDAKMFNYMPFNMGIGFHSLAGTGYYGNLGLRPSSHGCIRMRADDVKALFKECEVGTLVLVHRGKTARVIAFAPAGFKNERDYSKDDYMNLLAYNLNSIFEGKYFINPPKRFIIDPSIIPRIGYNIGSTDDIPEKQQIPLALNNIEMKNDLMNTRGVTVNPVEQLDTSILRELGIDNDSSIASDIDVSPDLVKKLVYNPIGILPYFPPNK